MDSTDIVIGREPTELKWDDLSEKEKEFHLWFYFSFYCLAVNLSSDNRTPIYKLLQRINWWFFVHAQKSTKQPLRSISRFLFRYVSRPLKDCRLIERLRTMGDEAFE